MMLGIAAGVAFLVVLEQCSGVRNFSDPEERLKKHLLDGYDKTVRPGVIENGVKQPLVVTVAFAPYRIIGFDERLETMSLLTIIIEAWEDPRLVWDPTEFGGITMVDFHVDNLWTPRSYIPNLLVLNKEDKTALRNFRVIMTEPGPAIVSMMTYAILQERCKFDMTYYPFDRQGCHACISPTQYTMADLLYNASYYPINYPRDADGGEWDLEHASTFNSTAGIDTHACLWLIAQRRSLYYVVNLFVPTLCICLLNTIGLFASIDADQDELAFANLGQTTLLSLSVLMLTVADQTPRGSLTVSLMGIFFLGTIFHTLMAAVTAVYLRKWHRRISRVSQHEIYPKITSASDLVKAQAEMLWIWDSIAFHLSSMVHQHKAYPTFRTPNAIVKKQTEKKWIRGCMAFHLLLIAVIFSVTMAVGFVNKQKKPVA